jgi:hypothetical protein
VGCDDSGGSNQTAATVSPEMQRKTQENLKNYAERQAAQAKEQRSKKR